MRSRETRLCSRKTDNLSNHRIKHDGCAASGASSAGVNRNGATYTLPEEGEAYAGNFGNESDVLLPDNATFWKETLGTLRERGPTPAPDFYSQERQVQFELMYEPELWAYEDHALAFRTTCTYTGCNRRAV